MLQTTALPTHHSDLITDVAYDFYGERLATASADQRIKVFQRVPYHPRRQSHDSQQSPNENADRVQNRNQNAATPNGPDAVVSSSPASGWQLLDEFKAHQAPIVKLSWSHPEFGNLLASCGYDRTVRIWEEVKVPGTGGSSGTGGSVIERSGTSGQVVGSGGLSGIGSNVSGIGAGRAGNSAPAKRWIERGLLTDAKGSVRCVEFAPSAFGLKLASISTDSHLRIYTSLQPTPTDWQLTSSVSLPTLTLPSGSGSTQPHANLPAEDYPNSLTTSGTPVNNAMPQQGLTPGKGNEAMGGWSLSWCKEKWWGQVLAVTSGHSGIVKIISVSGTRPVALAILSPPSSHIPSISGSTSSYGLGAQAVSSLSWAPSCGRSYHLLATGARDGTVRVWKLRPPGMGRGEEGTVGGQSGGTWKVEVAGEWGRGEATVGKVEWNVTGTVLSIANEDGKVKLYKTTFSGEWACMGTFSAEAAPGITEDQSMVTE